MSRLVSVSSNDGRNDSWTVLWKRHDPCCCPELRSACDRDRSRRALLRDCCASALAAGLSLHGAHRGSRTATPYLFAQRERTRNDESRSISRNSSAAEALKTRIALTDTEVAKMKDSIKANRELLRSWRPGICGVQSEAAYRKKTGG